jgi:ectoine hydroxylase-related dioxygenase (phytanoyl-CoA dioxygenase family)
VTSATGRLPDDGFAVLEGFLTEGDLEQLQAEVDLIIRRPRHPSCTRPNNTLIPLRWSDRAIDVVLSSNERVRTLRERVAAADLRWISGYVSIKEAGSGALWWHQDWWCWEHPVSYRRSPAQLAVLCYLSATDRDRGALRLLPGSHRRSCALHGAVPADSVPLEETLAPDHPLFGSQPDEYAVCVSAGDAVVIDFRLLHATCPNLTRIRRDCLILNFTPSWRDLPEEIRGHLIRHHALPGPDDLHTAHDLSWMNQLLPRFDGPSRDLPLSRRAPSEFEVRE